MKRIVLVLNADFTPLKFVSWEEAMIQILVPSKTGAYTVENYENWTIQDAKGRKYAVPAVIALKKYVDVVDEPASYTKSNIYARDRMTCQYCGQQFKRGQLTIDHVIPRSRWKLIGNGQRVSSFENTVTACKDCNSRKADMTCTEAKMFPINKPVPITVRQNFFNRLRVMDYRIPKEWEPYLKGIISEQREQVSTP